MPILPHAGRTGKCVRPGRGGHHEGNRAADLAGIQPVSPRRVSEQVADQIRGLIARERLAEGDRLPPERDLAERFGISRPMVSQALRMLSLMGLVEIRQGSGAYVLRRPQHMVADTVFHANVVRAAGNAYLTAMYEGVHTAVLSQEHETWVRTEAEPGWLAGSGRSVLLAIHQAIYDAVAAGDAGRAQAAVLRHHEVMLEHLGR